MAVIVEIIRNVVKEQPGLDLRFLFVGGHIQDAVGSAPTTSATDLIGGNHLINNRFSAEPRIYLGVAPNGTKFVGSHGSIWPGAGALPQDQIRSMTSMSSGLAQRTLGKFT